MDEIDTGFCKPGLNMESDQQYPTEKSGAELTREFFNLWSNIYEATYGRLFEVPALGPMRERYEKWMRNVSVSIHFYTAWTESLANFQQVFIEAMRKTREKMISDVRKGEISQDIYRDFYKIWIETYSETFKEFLKSGHFASDIGALTSDFVDFQKSNQELLEENVLKPLRLPTREEVDEINKEVYSLKKTVRELTRQVRELSERR